MIQNFSAKIFGSIGIQIGRNVVIGREAGPHFVLFGQHLFRSSEAERFDIAEPRSDSAVELINPEVEFEGKEFCAHWSDLVDEYTVAERRILALKSAAQFSSLALQ